MQRFEFYTETFSWKARFQDSSLVRILRDQTRTGEYWSTFVDRVRNLKVVQEGTAFYSLNLVPLVKYPQNKS